MTENIIQKLIDNDINIKQKIKNRYFMLTMLLNNKEIELYLTDTCLIYNKKYIEYKYIKNIKEYVNEPTTFIYCGKNYANIRSPDITIEYYQNFIYALKLKIRENK